VINAIRGQQMIPKRPHMAPLAARNSHFQLIEGVDHVAMNGLDRSIGFRVISADGYVGTVEEIVYGADNSLSALVIGTRRAERPLVLVGVEEVLGCFEHSGSLILSPSWRSSAVEMPVAASLVA
jgi:hypothetical protein